ncbi:hypothetical protein VAE308_580003 [Vibrio aestuarianus]|uniref:Uncharacterized protein n=1 Tax=Vibrio aestuarianus TaxID=28171 RepID=A0ABM9FM05_9VIBR|nr:hypothetical protein VAE063_30003 [Vibrio aestuarianus]CAH8234095.1 hypothetical protein VAE308_580003 [Vibrio aestuarianus]
MFQLLTTLNEINFNTISEKLNTKKMVLEGETYCDSYIWQWVSCLTCASQGVYHRFLTNHAS